MYNVTYKPMYIAMYVVMYMMCAPKNPMFLSMYKPMYIARTQPFMYAIAYKDVRNAS
jgi:hypothetical protein